VLKAKREEVRARIQQEEWNLSRSYPPKNLA